MNIGQRDSEKKLRRLVSQCSGSLSRRRDGASGSASSRCDEDERDDDPRTPEGSPGDEREERNPEISTPGSTLRGEHTAQTRLTRPSPARLGTRPRPLAPPRPCTCACRTEPPRWQGSASTRERRGGRPLSSEDSGQFSAETASRRSQALRLRVCYEIYESSDKICVHCSGSRAPCRGVPGFNSYSRARARPRRRGRGATTTRPDSPLVLAPSRQREIRCIPRRRRSRRRRSPRRSRPRTAWGPPGSAGCRRCHRNPGRTASPPPSGP